MGTEIINSSSKLNMTKKQENVARLDKKCYKDYKLMKTHRLHRHHTNRPYSIESRRKIGWALETRLQRPNAKGTGLVLDDFFMCSHSWVINNFSGYYGLKSGEFAFFWQLESANLFRYGYTVSNRTYIITNYIIKYYATAYFEYP